MHSEKLFKNLFQQPFPHQDNGPFIQDLVNKYPWFGLAHFYHLKSTALGHKDYNKRAAVAAQYFPNIYLLQQRLNQKTQEETDLSLTNAVQPTADQKETLPEAIAAVTHKDLPIDAANETITKDEIKENEAVSATPETPETTDKFTVSAAETTPAANEMLFEPLHATDYFASQGIKLSEELQPTDKLGHQLKSFTSWLKTMKKTPEQQTNTQQIADDITVQHLASKSNVEAEVVTESMAEVYLQQNKPQKAIEIYKKLSLINTDKSAYFAAKIENLNKK